MPPRFQKQMDKKDAKEFAIFEVRLEASGTARVTAHPHSKLRITYIFTPKQYPV
jgi:hypothetical protein